MPNDHQSPPSLPGPSDIPVVQFDDVLREELQLISNRRRVLFPHIVKRDGSPITETPPRYSSAGTPEEEKNTDQVVTVQREAALDEHLAGLAFSGGGIRSASFAIGVLQGLGSLKLLNWFDYLSTVSGGGYAGGWLVAWLSREGNPINVEQQLDVNRVQQAKASRHYAENPSANPPAWKPLTQDHTADKIAKRGLILDEEPEPVVHLRAYSSYLTPRGGLFSADTWAMLAIYLRNVCINLLILLPLLFALTLSIRYIIELFVWSLEPCVQVERSLGELGLFALFVLGLLLGFLGLACSAIAVWGLRSVPRSFELDNRKLSRGVVLPLLVASVLVALSYQASLNVIRRFAQPVLAWLQPVLAWLGMGVPSLDKAYFLSHFSLLLPSVLFGAILSLGSLFHLWRQKSSNAAVKIPPRGPGIPQPLAAFCGGAVTGILFAVTEEILRFTNQQPWARAVIGPPLLQGDIVAGFGALVALLGVQVNELEREWWGRLAGRLLRGSLVWLILTALIVYGPAVVYGIGAIAGPSAQLALGAVWAAVTGAGVQAGRSSKTGSGIQRSRLELLCVLAPPIFLAGLLTILSLVASFVLDATASDASGRPIPTQIVARQELAAVVKAQAPERDLAVTTPRQPSTADVFLVAFSNGVETLRNRHELVLIAFLFVSGVIAALFAIFVDVNLFSLHAFYANRLIRAFLGASRPNRRWTQRWGKHDRMVEAGGPTNAFGSPRDADPVTDFDDEDDIDLVDLRIGSPLKGRNRQPIEDPERKPVACYWGPHYLINTTMNLVASDNLAWRDRKAEAFCLSPLYCGSKSTGFVLVTEQTRGNLTLGRSIAVSGAAVDPNMSFHQSPPMTALLTLFNARLGIWIQNPENVCDLRLMSPVNKISGLPRRGKNLIVVAAVGKVLHFRIFNFDGEMVLDTDENRLTDKVKEIKALKEQLESLWPPHEITGNEKVRIITAVTSIVGRTRAEPAWDARGPGVGFPLIWELLGLTDSHSNFVHISDGGHFENLGVYELLRRRCRYVVAVDATENANATSDNLGILVRLARIDLGIRILLDTAPLTLQGPERYSNTHVIIGEIRYDDVHPSATPGILVYIRASLTGDEPPDVQQYANNHPEFPRQSTADQFFDEEQFESYRALGSHVACEVFEEAASDLQDWLQKFVKDWDEETWAKQPDYATGRAHARLFGTLRNRWLVQPTGDKQWYADSVRAFVALQRELRDKPKLARLAQELYPELGDDSQSTTEEHVALHMHEEILQHVENAWLGLGLDRRRTANIDRGWMNWLRRLTSTPSFRRFWPLLRAEYSPDFQSFCERLLRLDADDPRLVELIPSNDGLIPEGQFAEVLDGRISSGVMQVQIIAAEFAREWPDFVRGEVKNFSGVPLDRLGAQFIHDRVKKSAELELAGQKLDAAWLIVQPPKGHLPKSEPGQDFIVGILIIAAAEELEHGYDLFYWVRPAHRSSGIGEKIIMHKDIVGLHENLKGHSIQEGQKREKQIRVRYPASGDAWTRSRWLNFFALYDFKPETDFEPGKDWVLSRELR